jgi:peptidoglycan/xylan/chitin deacetylase (PgdA/CDA1 family)
MFFSLPVLMYHSVSRFRNRLCVPPELFEEHCRTLAGAGWRGVSLHEAEGYFLRKESLPAQSFLFTFDDGYLDNYVYAEPLLRRYGHRGAIFPVVGCVGEGETCRPSLDDLDGDVRAAALSFLDQRPPTPRRGMPVRGMAFCNWAELARMREKGALAPAPHSMTHGRVVGDLTFTRLYQPGHVPTFFDIPPYRMPFGFPLFKLKHAFSGKGYTIVPELFELIRGMVPQHPKEAGVFLKDEKNRLAVANAVAALPCLGVPENEAEYRARMFRDFAECRAVFKARLGIEPVSFCWPWGDYGKVALEEARKAGFRLFFTTARGANTRGRKHAARRIPVRGGSGEDLLALVRFASNSLFEEPYSWAWNYF